MPKYQMEFAVKTTRKVQIYEEEKTDLKVENFEAIDDSNAFDKAEGILDGAAQEPKKRAELISLTRTSG